MFTKLSLEGGDTCFSPYPYNCHFLVLCSYLSIGKIPANQCSLKLSLEGRDTCYAPTTYMFEVEEELSFNREDTCKPRRFTRLSLGRRDT
jgi:hypothetical protein